MKLVKTSAPLVWVLLGAALALGCEWDLGEDQGLDLISYSPDLGSPAEVTDAEQCKAGCCLKPDCDVALVGAPQDGPLLCYLVKCKDQCHPVSSSQFQAFRKRPDDDSDGSVRLLSGETGKEEKNQQDESGQGNSWGKSMKKAPNKTGQ